MLCSNANTRSSIFDCFDGVLDLEVSAIRRKDGVGEIIACSYRRLVKTELATTLLQDGFDDLPLQQARLRQLN